MRHNSLRSKCVHSVSNALVPPVSSYLSKPSSECGNCPTNNFKAAMPEGCFKVKVKCSCEAVPDPASETTTFSSVPLNTFFMALLQQRLVRLTRLQTSRRQGCTLLPFLTSCLVPRGLQSCLLSECNEGYMNVFPCLGGKARAA